MVLAARRLALDAVQLHGEEDARYISGLRNMLPEATEIWAAGAVGDEAPAARMGADRTIFDTKVGSRSGGTGVAFDWERVRGRADLGRSLLAGGLKPGNAREAAKLGPEAHYSQQQQCAYRGNGVSRRDDRGRRER